MMLSILVLSVLYAAEEIPSDPGSVVEVSSLLMDSPPQVPDDISRDTDSLGRTWLRRLDAVNRRGGIVQLSLHPPLSSPAPATDGVPLSTVASDATTESLAETAQTNRDTFHPPSSPDSSPQPPTLDDLLSASEVVASSAAPPIVPSSGNMPAQHPETLSDAPLSKG